ncbi:MAG: hypothetical protein GTN99_08030 [Candidatus Dadabacteria bacterium]|nr:hypothetical protein [Candidatus Dadabacteria bacterium]
MKNLIIAVDFDGTLVHHEYPDIGAEVPEAIACCKYLQDKGAELILWTMRSDHTLKEALRWCHDRGLYFYGVNVNPDQSWTRSPKAYAHYYIDDAACGCPLLYHPGKRPVVDWPAVLQMITVKEEYLNG